MTGVQNQSSSIEVADNMQLYDHEIKAILEGPMEWYDKRKGSWRNVEEVYQGLAEQFEKIGLRVEVQVWTFGEHGIPVAGAWMFKVVIQGRIERGPKSSGFDYDKMSHEVQSNLLDIAGENVGKIKFDEKAFLRQHGGGPSHKH